MKKTCYIVFLLIVALSTNAKSQGSWVSDSCNGFARRAYLGSAVLNGKIYAIGGDLDPFFDGVTDTVEIFNPITHTWSPGPSMPLSVSNLSCNSINGKIYAIGGLNGIDSNNAFQILDSATGIWSMGPIMPKQRNEHSSVILNEKIYVFGGYDDGPFPTNSMTIFDIGANDWYSGPAMVTARASMASCVLGNKIYAIGGIDSSSRPVATVEIFDPSLNSWSAGTSLPLVLSDCACGILNGKIFVCGGMSEYIDSKVLAIFDTATNVWTLGPAMPSGRMDFTCAIIGNKMYAIGGLAGGCCAVDSVYDFVSQEELVSPADVEYPNLRFLFDKASNELQILPGPIGTLRIYDLLGGEVLEANDDGSGVALDVSHLTNGTYFLRLGTASTKIVISH